MFRLEKFMNFKTGIHCLLKKRLKLSQKTYKNSIEMGRSLSEQSDSIHTKIWNFF